jgi:hypothetical protein
MMAPEYAAVAKSWQSNKNSNSHFFASLDFEHGQAIYQKVSSPEVGRVLRHSVRTS